MEHCENKTPFELYKICSAPLYLAHKRRIKYNCQNKALQNLSKPQLTTFTAEYLLSMMLHRTTRSSAISVLLSSWGQVMSWVGGWVKGSGRGSIQVKLPPPTDTYPHPQDHSRPESKYHNNRVGQKCFSCIPS